MQRSTSKVLSPHRRKAAAIASRSSRSYRNLRSQRVRAMSGGRTDTKVLSTFLERMAIFCRGTVQTHGHARAEHRYEARMIANRSLVSIVDDDESVRESLPDLVRQFGFAAEAFSSAEAFLASDVVSETSCLLLDVAMPGMSGPDLQQELMHRRPQIPIVFITASGDRVGPSTSARARRRGVPVQAVQRGGPARRAQRRACG